MKKKYWKLLALVIALGLIGFLLGFANSLVGNPLSKYLAQNSAEKHLQEVYPDTDYYVERLMFSFKDSNYHAFILSPTSVDTDFSLTIDQLGRVRWDTYDSVERKFTTASRLNDEYRALTDPVFLSPDFPYECQIDYGILEIYPQEAFDDPQLTDISDYALVQEELILDHIYDIHALGRQAGHLIVYIDCDTLTPEYASQILLDIRAEFDEAGIPFRTIDLTLQYPLPEEGQRPDDYLGVKDFLYEEIYPEGLAGRVAQAHQELEEYYASQNK